MYFSTAVCIYAEIIGDEHNFLCVEMYDYCRINVF